ncbi:MAG: ABC transporter ATP-binding protein [Candidatus Omnitrophica bacterium]|nr:ABC transporter ATP-binding protein [Candidatus Omnitrophota bacterium]
MTPVIQLKDISVLAEGRIPLLRDVSWTVGSGENWVILGANGSGKTTLLNLLNAYGHPSSGTMRVLGQSYGRYDWRDLRKSIGLVSTSIEQRVEGTETALETVMSGYRAVINFWGPVSRGMKTRARQILRRVECADTADRRWQVLSQGERQRVLIGRALMARLKILILDEPCAGLDPIARERFLLFLEKLAAGRAAPLLILVTHHVEEITPCYTHVMLLKNGHVLAAGPRREIMTTANLSETFGAPLRLLRHGGRYRLAMSGDRTTWTPKGAL